MAENVITSDDELLKNIKTLLWGSTVKEDVFKRWAQGSEIYQLTFSREMACKVTGTVTCRVGITSDQQLYVLSQL